MVSRQTLVNRRTDTKRLQTLLDQLELPARVEYQELKGYVVRPLGKGEPITRGRFEVVYAWVTGYAYARWRSHWLSEKDRAAAAVLDAQECRDQRHVFSGTGDCWCGKARLRE